MRTRRDRPIRIGIAIASSLIALTLLVAISPVVLSWVGSRRSNWVELSAIGQTYAAASAAISTLVLVAVAFSLILQARQAKQARVQTMRESHVTLIKMALDDPVYFQSWGGPFRLQGVDDRLVAYTNLVVSFWEAKWDLGEMTEIQCSMAGRNFFASELGRSYWECYGPGRAISAAPGRRRFYAIMNAEFARSITEGPPASPLVNPSKPPDSKSVTSGPMQLEEIAHA
jgi:hypothetical protein